MRTFEDNIMVNANPGKEYMGCTATGE